jgi:hypothetical protein
MFAQYSCASPCYRFAITNSVVHAGWSQTTQSECCFGLYVITLSTRVSSQTDFLIVTHVYRTGPPNNADLNPCDYFLWGFLTEKIFPKKLQAIMELSVLIIQARNEITEDMCRRVINNITVRVKEITRRNGGHIEP